MNEAASRRAGSSGGRPVAGSRVSAALAAFLGLAALAPPAAAADAQAGHDLALRWCTSCHIVDRSAHGTDTAPPFPGIAERNAHDLGWVRAWLTAPHPPMPNFNLERAQIDDLIAYLESLAPR
jgi:mono/diheme cytochrome c family protein